MKKLLSLLGAIGLVATSSASVVACGDKGINAGETVNVSITFTSSVYTAADRISEKLNLEDGVVVELFDSKDKLNEFVDVLKNPTADNANKISTLPISGLLEEDGEYFYIAYSMTEKLELTLVSNGSVEFVPLIDLSNAVKVTELGELADKEDQTIVDAVNAKNDGLNISVDDVDIYITGDEAKETATIKANYDSSSVTGEVDVTFSVSTNKVDISTLKDGFKEFSVGDLQSDFESYVQTTLNDVASGVEKGVDYDISYISKPVDGKLTKGMITIWSKADSKLIYGDFDIVAI